MRFSKKALLLAALLALVSFSGFGCAAKKTSQPVKAPEAVKAATFAKYPKIVDAAFVANHMMTPMPGNVMVIDSRPRRAKYDKGHIPMAVSIPFSQFDKMTDKLPKDKDALLIFYCGGLKCPLSHKSAFKAEKLGYRNVKVFAKGFPAWKKVPGNYAGVSPEWMKKQIDKKADIAIVDSRPKRKKYDKGHIPTAVNIPWSQFDRFAGLLPADKAKPVVFYCGGFKCPLSHKSAKKAITLGHTNVKVFAAGYPAWKKVAGVTAAAKQVSQVKAGREEGSIDIDAFKKIVDTMPETVMLIDVRDPAEYAAGTFPSAINIPSETLEAKISSLPADKPVVFICSTGARSGEAFYMVQDVRPAMKNVYYVEGEISFMNDGSYRIVPGI